MMELLILFLLVIQLITQISASQYQSIQVLANADNDYTCSPPNPARLAAAGQCTDKATGKGWSNATACPLKVCCSKFGFVYAIGTTSDFCGGTMVISPQCDGTTAHQRTIGYYEGWNLDQRLCDKMAPEDARLGIYTHINFAFALINPTTFRIAPMDQNTGTRYQSITSLKNRQPSLKVWIAIGGWAMNDPGATRTTFSDLAASEANQDIFFETLVSFMLSNRLDGVDLDWEYPAAADRGFDIINLKPYVDPLNIMAYNIHGAWDGSVESLGKHALAHTNLSEINLALELLWRNIINPARINLCLGFYGRIFTLASRDSTEGVLSATDVYGVVENGNG
ncbi:glycoside hydrolase superfamily [Aspergillus cavernicola]|uniref:chitinase n=1 Tax=Aspergillus cavernicola TaxID=176166 RepID=A0ABR4HG56_9EURO